MRRRERERERGGARGIGRHTEIKEVSDVEKER